MQTETSRFTCDAAECVVVYESETYIGSRPENWIEIDFTPPRLSGRNGVRHFCSWDHAGQWVNAQIEKEREEVREEAERRRKEAEARPARVVRGRSATTKGGQHPVDPR